MAKGNDSLTKGCYNKSLNHLSHFYYAFYQTKHVWQLTDDVNKQKVNEWEIDSKYLVSLTPLSFQNGILCRHQVGSCLYLHHPLHADHPLQDLDQVSCQEPSRDHFKETEWGVGEVSLIMFMPRQVAMGNKIFKVKIAESNLNSTQASQ